jgi:hypothetical protein
MATTAAAVIVRMFNVQTAIGLENHCENTSAPAQTKTASPLSSKATNRPTL